MFIVRQCFVVCVIAASERSERAATLIWPSRTGHLYIAVPYSTFPGSRDFFYEYEVHRSAVKRDSVRPHAGLPEICCRFGRKEFDTVYTTKQCQTLLES